MRLNLIEIGISTACLDLGAIALGSITSIIAVVSKYVLPKLGFHTIYGISMTSITRSSIAVAATCWTAALFLSIAIFIMLRYIGPIVVPFNNILFHGHSLAQPNS